MAESMTVTIFEIKEEFATCEICMEEFDEDSRSARSLPCSHSFCSACLECIWDKSPSGVQCPKCRRTWPVETDIKKSFPRNNVLMNLVEYLELKNKPENILCWKCPSNMKASMHCLDCQKYLCENCSHSHKRFLDDHKTVPLSEFMKSPETFFQKKGVCQDHDKMKMDLFCKNKTCQKAACISCAYVLHKDHDICNLKDIYKEKKDETTRALDCLVKSSEKCEHYRNELVSQKNKLMNIQQNLLQFIDNSENEIVAKVKEKSRRLKEEVIANINRQQKERDRQLDLVAETEKLKSEHVLFCHQALSFTGAAEFIAMSDDLTEKTVMLSEPDHLIDMHVEDVAVDFSVFHTINKVLENSLNDISQLRNCLELTDVKLGEQSTFLKVTLLTGKDNFENQHFILQAVIEDQNEKKHEVEQDVNCLSHPVGALTFKAECLGPHKISIRLNGCLLNKQAISFDCKDSDVDLMRRILISIDSKPGYHREIFLPDMEFDTERLNWEQRSITPDGCLVSECSEKPDVEHPNRLRNFSGVCSRTVFTGAHCHYWQVTVTTEMKESDELGFVSAHIGLSHQDSCDISDFEVSDRAWCVEVRTCQQHESVCLYVFSRGKLLHDHPVASCKPGAVVVVDVGLLLDLQTKCLHILHVQNSTVVVSVADVDTSQPLLPMFATYSPTLFDVRIKPISGQNLVISPDLSNVISSVIQQI